MLQKGVIVAYGKPGGVMDEEAVCKSVQYGSRNYKDKWKSEKLHAALPMHSGGNARRAASTDMKRLTTPKKDTWRPL